LQHVNDLPTPPSARRAALTTELDAVVLKALSKNPADRYATCGEFAQALRAALANMQERRFLEIVQQVKTLLAAHNSAAARALLDEANQLIPDHHEAQKLFSELDQLEQAQSGYDTAAAQLTVARTRAADLRAQTPPAYPDADGLLETFAPLPKAKPLLDWTKWRAVSVGAAVTLACGLLASCVFILFSESPSGVTSKATMVAVVRTSTPTSTYTPTHTPTHTPTYTPTFTPTPTKTNTPTNTPTPSIGSTQTSKTDGMVQMYVPAGAFTMGDGSDNHTVTLNAFWIDKTEVTNAMYALCVKAGKCTPPKETKSYTRGNYYGNSLYDNYPVIYVSWNDAVKYCSWVGRRLPTEAEWEKAARGTDGRIYPWGNSFDASKLNSYEGSVDDTTEVGKYPSGASVYGALDMAGNVWEWVSSKYKPYPYSATDGGEDLTGNDSRALRGGSWNYLTSYVRATYRLRLEPSFIDYYVGFRCASSP
jgi:formylglycine-generating enzyme required for sulfatase activity